MELAWQPPPDFWMKHGVLARHAVLPPRASLPNWRIFSVTCPVGNICRSAPNPKARCHFRQIGAKRLKLWRKLIPLTCSLGCFTKHFIDKIGYKMVLHQPTSRQQVGTLYEMTSPSSLWNASPQTTRVQRHAARHRATTQLSSIKCCSNLGVVSEALLQYGKTYVYKMPFPQAVANPSDLIQWRSDVQLVWL